MGAHGIRRWAPRSPHKSMTNRGTYGVGWRVAQMVPVVEMPHIKPPLGPLGTRWGLLGGMTGPSHTSAEGMGSPEGLERLPQHARGLRPHPACPSPGSGEQPDTGRLREARAGKIPQM